MCLTFSALCLRHFIHESHFTSGNDTVPIIVFIFRCCANRPSIAEMQIGKNIVKMNGKVHTHVTNLKFIVL